MLLAVDRTQTARLFKTVHFFLTCETYFQLLKYLSFIGIIDSSLAIFR